MGRCLVLHRGTDEPLSAAFCRGDAVLARRRVWPARRALDKIRAELPEAVRKRVQAIDAHVTQFGGAARRHDERRRELEDLALAIEASETVELHYRTPGNARRGRGYERRLVDPVHLHVHLGGVYLAAYCHDRQASRTFLLDRIGAVRRTGRHFENTPAIDPRDHFHGAFGAWTGKPVRVRLRFVDEASTWITERTLHPSQTTQLRRDGSVDVTIKVPLSPALVSFVVGFGPRAHVVAPKDLSERVRREHVAALASQGRQPK